MNSLLRSISFLVAGIVFSAIAYSVEYANVSRLAEGKWVKIRIGETGLYAIPYSELREMGFDTPENVGVYGKGGEMLSVNFEDGVLAHSFYDDLAPLSVIQDEDRLIFYAEGVDKVVRDLNSRRFKRRSKNIYSDYGVYFLSDRYSPQIAEKTEGVGVGFSADKSGMDDELSKEISKLRFGMDYILHERDLCHNVTNSGQQYWGEEFKENGGEMKWTVPVSFATSGLLTLECEFYVEPSTEQAVAYKVDMEVDECAEKYSVTSTIRKTEEFLPQNHIAEFSFAHPDIGDGKEIANDRFNFNVKLGVSAEKSDFSRLDYWLLSYPKKFPVTGEELKEPEIYSIDVTEDKRCCLSFADGITIVDVTDPKRVKVSMSKENSDGCLINFPESGIVDVVLFSSHSEFNKIKDWEIIENSNLHGADYNDTELVIITVPRFKEYGLQIAELHKIHEGIECAVVTPEELYNEFSGGVPDPMAYRAFLKMVYERGCGKLKNVLLLGPSQGDMRALKGDGDIDCIIAYQEPKATTERDAASVYDFYGMLADEVNPDRLYREKMEIGVGLLSCYDEEDCQRAVRKIKRYLGDSENRAWILNETLQIGGLEDVHAHDKNAIRFGELINTLSHKPVVSYNLSIDAFGKTESKKRFLTELEGGKVMTVYFGHGSYMFMGGDDEFFTTSDIPLLKNRHLGFAFLGGCDFSRPDNRIKGLGESFVIDSENGMVGAIVSSRSSHSVLNYELAKRIAKSWMEREYGTQSPTAGEFYAAAKSKSNYRNSLNYFYSGDPALRFPVATQKIEATIGKGEESGLTKESDVVPGKIFKLSGVIQSEAGTPDKRFEGKIIVKVAKPAMRLQSMDYETGTYRNVGELDTIYIDYKGDHLIAFEGDVKDGTFEMELILPQSVNVYNGQLLPIYLSAYDNVSDVGAVGYIEGRVNMDKLSEENMAEYDTAVPDVDVIYDYTADYIRVYCSDNAGLNISPEIVTVRLDGEMIRMNVNGRGGLSECAKSVEYSYDAIGVDAGSHILEIEVEDIAGNTAKKVYEFQKPTGGEKIGVHLSSKAVVDSLVIEVDDEEEVLLVVRDADGKTVLEREISGEYCWDCKGDNGKLLNHGVYSLKVIEQRTGVHKRCSEWIRFSILK